MPVCPKQWKQRRQPNKLSRAEYKRLSKLIEIEREVAELGYERIAGIDEVGRGPLAGPVVAAACVIEKGVLIAGINDSKLVAPLKRAAIFDILKGHPGVRYGIGVIDSEIIDEINIYQATLKAMQEAVVDLCVPPDFILVDGVELKASSIPYKKIVGGDARAYCIAAASIIAKETRDKMMRDYHQLYPNYGFDEHKGYGTPKHLQALSLYGPCTIHRKSFAPIKQSLMKSVEI